MKRQHLSAHRPHRPCRLAGFRWIAACLLACSVPVSTQGAGPSDRDPDAPLATHGTATSEAWFKEASSLYESAQKNLAEFLEKEQNNALKNVKAEDLGKTYVQVTMIGRGGNWLQIWGEPAGADFEMRAATMHNHLNRLVESSKAFPATQRYIENFRGYVAKTQAGQTRALGNIEKLCQDKKWPAAEALLFKVYDTLAPGTIFLTAEENRAIYLPFSHVDGAITTAMAELRNVTAEQELTKAAADLTPDFVSLQQEIAAAVDSVVANGSATWRGESLSGPAVLGKFGDVWRETQVRALQCRAKKWALAFRFGQHGHYGDSGGPDPFTVGYQQWSDSIKQGVVRMVEGDAQRVPASDLQARYIEYLQALAPLANAARDPAWNQALGTAVGQLAARDPALQQAVSQYQAATADLLRWRARVATAQRTAHTATYAPLPERFEAGTTSGNVLGTEYTGLFLATPGGPTQPQLLTHAPAIMPVAIQRLKGQKTTLRDVVRLTPDSPRAIARYTQRTYANLPSTADLTREAGRLQTDLLSDSSHPPLTLAATEAVLSAQRGDLVAAGGTITGLTLEGVVPRFATLPATAIGLTDLGRLPEEKFDGQPLRNMLMRFEVTPEWVCHEYFFVALPAEMPSAVTWRVP